MEYEVDPNGDMGPATREVFDQGFNAGLDKFKQDFDTRMDKIDAMLADMVKMLEDLK